MGDLGEALAILAFVLLTVVQAVAAQKKKNRQREERRRIAETGGLPKVEQSSEGKEIIDLGDLLGGGAGKEQAPERAAGSGGRPSSSEELIPKEIWEEIAELAGGRRTGPKAPGPLQTPTPAPAPTQAPPVPEGFPRSSRESPPDRKEEALTLARERTREVGLRTSPRSAPVQEPLPAAVSQPAVPEAAALSPIKETAPEIQLEITEAQERGPQVDELLGDRSADTLRRAILLREILGPPLALREEAEEV